MNNDEKHLSKSNADIGFSLSVPALKGGTFCQRMSQYKLNEVRQLSANNYLKLPAKRKTQLSPLFFLNKAEKSWVSLWWPMYERRPPIRTPPSPPFTLASQNAELRRVSCIHGQLLEILAPDFFSSHVLYFVSAVSSISTKWLAS